MNLPKKKKKNSILVIELILNIFIFVNHMSSWYVINIINIFIYNIENLI